MKVEEIYILKRLKQFVYESILVKNCYTNVEGSNSTKHPFSLLTKLITGKGKRNIERLYAWVDNFNASKINTQTYSRSLGHGDKLQH